MIATNISDFRSNIRQYVDNVLNDGNTVIINRGNTAAVLISLDEYNSIRETEILTCSANVDEDIVDGVSRLESGDGIVVDIDSL